jgi:hypothetical protein
MNAASIKIQRTLDSILRRTLPFAFLRVPAFMTKVFHNSSPLRYVAEDWSNRARCWLSRGAFRPILPHRVAAHLHAVRDVKQPVENAVGHARMADLFVRAGYRGGSDA